MTKNNSFWRLPTALAVVLSLLNIFQSPLLATPPSYDEHHEHQSRRVLLSSISSSNVTTRSSDELPPWWLSSCANNRQFPSWLQDYFAFHQAARRQLTNNWKAYKYMVVRCLASDSKCGGASDRLQSLPFMILMAHVTNRLLFFQWERPAPLQEFLVPPPFGGLDWRIPPELASDSDFRTDGPVDVSAFNQIYKNHFKNPASDKTVITVRLQADGHGASAFNRYHNENLFSALYRQIWDCVFVPSPNVTRALHQAHAQSGLLSNAGEVVPYSAVHIRSMYHKNLSNVEYTYSRPVSCMAHHQKGPIFVAADSPTVANKCVQYGREHFNDRHIVTRPPQTTLHLDRGSAYVARTSSDWNWQDYPPAAYYNIFVDLYLLADASCITYHFGGFGRWARALSRNATCAFDYGYFHCDAHEKRLSKREQRRLQLKREGEKKYQRKNSWTELTEWAIAGQG